MRLFFVFILFLWSAMHVYVFWRASSVPAIARYCSHYTLGGLGLFLWGSYFLARILGHLGMTTLARVLEFLGANWVGVIFLLLVVLLFVDVVTLFGVLLLRAAPALRGWALVAGGALSIIALVQGTRAPVVQKYEVHLAGLPANRDGTVIVFASDFHLGNNGTGWLSDRIDQIEGQRPDIIILGGDIVEGDDASELELLPQLRRLSAPLGVWAVTGNHEFHAAGLESGNNLLDATGFHVLHGRWVEVRPGLVLAGVDDLTSRRRHGDTGASVKRVLDSRPGGTATVLVSHTPSQVETAAASSVGLMLSSHTHDGQIWPFGYIVRMIHPFVSGRYKVDGMTLIVCRGTGTWGPRMRLWRRGEIVRITLRSQQPRTHDVARHDVSAGRD